MLLIFVSRVTQRGRPAEDQKPAKTKNRQTPNGLHYRRSDFCSILSPIVPAFVSLTLNIKKLIAKIVGTSVCLFHMTFPTYIYTVPTNLISFFRRTVTLSAVPQKCQKPIICRRKLQETASFFIVFLLICTIPT